MAHWTLRLATADQQQREYIVRIFRHWRFDTGLAGVRDTESLEALPAPEREHWTALWTQVDGLLAKASE